MSTDVLIGALSKLITPISAFDAIRWCPEQHVLSFRPTGMDEWVNLWLHSEGFDHAVERNGQPGGSADKELWSDGRWVEGEDGTRSFTFNIPARFGPEDYPEEYRDRVQHYTPKE